jgi:hypothetical protein
MEPTPWDLQGEGLMVASGWLLRAEEVEPMVPDPLEVVRVLPGRTLGGIFVSRFDLGTDAAYNELGFVPALTRHEGTLGFFVERIFVDNPLVMRGVFESTGIERKSASFQWDAARGAVEVSNEGGLICGVRWDSRPFFLMRSKFSLPALGIANGRVVEFDGELSGQIGFVRADVHLPAGGPLDLMSRQGPMWSLCVDDWQVRLSDPNAVTESEPWLNTDWEPSPQ